MLKSYCLTLIGIAAIAAFAVPATAQVQTVDPNQAGQPATGQAQDQTASDPGEYQPVDAGSQDAGGQDAGSQDARQAPQAGANAAAPLAAAPPAATPRASGDTIPRDDVFSAAESVFGKGAKGLAKILENILRDQGQPTAYIAGQEAGGAIVVGVRYGSGTMHHQIEGDRLVYWTGPSVGFDFGADANKVFVLVYNLYDSQDLFRSYPSAEGHAYAVGGFAASYLRRGNVVIIPIRLGVGLRLGVNAGYMHFTEKNHWLPF
jgi:hypothetical protein